MKATGVVRRIDDLGRIVIPKEIRKTLRIKEGTPLEIFTEKEGDIVLKKYSPVSELSSFSQEYAECLSNVTNLISIVTDKDGVIAVSGTSKKNLLEESISEDLEKILDKRELFVSDDEKHHPINITKKNLENQIAGGTQIIVPIISNSELVGSLILIDKNPKSNNQDSNVIIAKVAANFLGTQMEI